MSLIYTVSDESFVKKISIEKTTQMKLERFIKFLPHMLYNVFLYMIKFRLTQICNCDNVSHLYS